MLRATSILIIFLVPLTVCGQANKIAKKTPLTKTPVVFKIAQLPDPITYIGNHCGASEISKQEILQADSLKIKQCFSTPSNLIVTRYEFTAVAHGKVYSISASGSLITDSMKKIISQVTNGSKVYFDCVNALAPDGSTKSYPGITIKIIAKVDTSLLAYKLNYKVGEPELYSFKYKLSWEIPNNKLSLIRRIEARCSCFAPDSVNDYKVLSFDLITDVRGKKDIYNAKGSSLTKEMYEALQHIPTSAKFRIEKIKVKTKDGIVGYLSPRTIKVIAP